MALKKIGGTIAATVLLGSAVTALPCEAKYRIEDGEIVLDSPFELEIGSAEYAKALGDGVCAIAYANYDPSTKKTTTNFNYHARARLTKPYFGCDEVSLSFKGAEKELEVCHFGIGGYWASDPGKVRMSYSKCREIVDKIVTDIGKHIGITMHEISIVKSEEDAKERIRSCLEEYKREKKNIYGCSVGVILVQGSKKVKGVLVGCRVTGTLTDKGDYSIYVVYSRRRDVQSDSYKFCDKMPVYTYKFCDKMPVYTNEMYSASSGNFVPTKEQQSAHEEAKKLREMVSRLLGVDFDNPAESALWKTILQEDKKVEWRPLAEPIEGMTEIKMFYIPTRETIPTVSCTLRRPFDGDITEAELNVQAKRFLDRLETEYGAKIPEWSEARATRKRLLGEGVPTFGDGMVTSVYDRKQYFIGKVGNLRLEIYYAPPLYAKRGGTLEIVCKGAIIVGICQTSDSVRYRANK